MNPDRPITLTIAALGGQGGGVVQNWMISLATDAGYWVQATSVPGVAQRTGATIYYLEFYPKPEPGQPKPVMALMPSPGNCDLVVASELAEAVRMIDRGIVSKDLTTIIASTHRAYTIAEKSHLGDGRANTAELRAVLDEHAARVMTVDMDAIAKTHQSVISAAILGGVAAAGVLPFEVEQYEQAIRQGGKGVEPSLAAFRETVASLTEAASTKHNTGRDPRFRGGDELDPGRQAVEDIQAPNRAERETILDARVNDFPEVMHNILNHAISRLVDYQDNAYADEFLARLKPFVTSDQADYKLSQAVAQGLVLWMSFEDTIRVADLKTRPERLRRLLKEHGEAGSVVKITEFMKPRTSEIAGTLPKGLGEWVEHSKFARSLLKPFTRGLRIQTNSVWGYLTLRTLAGLQGWRRRSLRYHQEMAMMTGWLERVRDIAQQNYTLAVELAKCQSLIAGYGDTHAHGFNNYQRIAEFAVAHVEQPNASEHARQLRDAALEDDTGAALQALISSYAKQNETTESENNVLVTT